MLRKTLLAATLLASCLAGAEPVKLGITGAIGAAYEVRLPIVMGQTMIEPFASHVRDNTRIGAEPPSNYQRNSLGLGLWRLLPLGERYYTQLGLQLAYEEDTSRYGSMTVFSDGDISGSEYQRESSGYSIAPAMGLFYKVTERAELGLEIKYQYANLEGEEVGRESRYPEYVWRDNPVADIKQSRSSLTTQAVARLYF